MASAIPDYWYAKGIIRYLSRKGWTKREELTGVFGLSRSKFYGIMAWMKDDFPDVPIISDAQKGYKLSDDEEEVARFVAKYSHYARTLIRRLRSDIYKHVQRTVEDESEREQILKLFDEAWQSLDRLVELAD